MVTSRIWFTAAQKAELWERWKNGQSAAAISRALERKNKTGVERIVVLHGGIVPAPRRRALAALRLEEREEISRGIAVGRGTIGIFVCEAVFRHASTKRSLNITANCVFASNHSRGGRFQSAAA